MAAMRIVMNLIGILITSAFLAPVVWLMWNFGVVKFIPAAPLVAWFDAFVVMLGYQILQVFTMRPVQHFPIYLPASAAHRHHEISEE